MGDLWIKQSDGSWQERDQNVAGPIVPPPTSDWTTGGIPPIGSVLVGGSAEGAYGTSGRNSWVATETYSNALLKSGLFRLYYSSANSESSMVSDCQWAHNRGMVPWISLKPANSQGVSWAQAGNGVVDSWAQARAEQLAALAPNPVWVCIHHEPENDQGGMADLVGLADWKAMQNRLLPIFKQYSNISTSIILMGGNIIWGSGGTTWDTWLPSGYADLDIYGIDPYNWWGTDNNTSNSDWDELGPEYMDPFNTWLEGKNSTYQHLRLGIAEWGYTDMAAALSTVPGNPSLSASHWLDRVVTDAKAKGVVGLSYFDIDWSTTWTWKTNNSVKGPRLGAALAQSDKWPGFA